MVIVGTRVGTLVGKREWRPPRARRSGLALDDVPAPTVGLGQSG